MAAVMDSGGGTPPSAGDHGVQLRTGGWRMRERWLFRGLFRPRAVTSLRAGEEEHPVAKDEVLLLVGPCGQSWYWIREIPSVESGALIVLTRIGTRVLTLRRMSWSVPKVSACLLLNLE